MCREICVSLSPISLVLSSSLTSAERRLPPRDPADFDSNRFGMTEAMAHGFYTVSSLFPKLSYTGKAVVLTDPPSGYTARMVHTLNRT